MSGCCSNKIGEKYYCVECEEELELNDVYCSGCGEEIVMIWDFDQDKRIWGKFF